MVAALILGFTAARRHDIPAHRAWMLRAYAIGLAAGTQAFTEGVGGALFGTGELSGDLAKAAGWVINLAVAEWIIRRRARSHRPRRGRGTTGRDLPAKVRTTAPHAHTHRLTESASDGMPLPCVCLESSESPTISGSCSLSFVVRCREPRAEGVEADGNGRTDGRQGRDHRGDRCSGWGLDPDRLPGAQRPRRCLGGHSAHRRATARRTRLRAPRTSGQGRRPHRLRDLQPGDAVGHHAAARRPGRGGPTGRRPHPHHHRRQAGRGPRLGRAPCPTRV